MRIKQVTALVLAGMLAFGMTACSSKPEASAPAASEPSDAATAIQTAGTGEPAPLQSEPTDTEGGDSVSQPVRTTAQPESTKKTTKATTPELLSGRFEMALKPLSGDQSAKLLTNPDRGFRLEVYYNLLKGNSYPSHSTDAYDFIDNMVFDYAEDNPQLAQCFFYVTEYYNKDFDQKVFDKLNQYFEHVRKKKLRLLIRFVYQWDEKDRVSGPSADQILRHITQLKPIIAQSQDVIHCWQAGFIGNWGEWHNEIVPISDQQKADILTALVDNSPAGMFIQTRMVNYRDTVPDSDPRKKRISYHDDYLTGEPNRWSCGLTPGNADYQKMIDQSGDLLVDGEMPWGSDKMMGEKFNGLSMAKYLSQRHYTSMSLIHNYRDAGPCTMVYWQEQNVNASTLDANGLRYQPSWYKKADGTAQSKTIFEYIQQYLGYHMEASGVKVTSSGKEVKVTMSILNYGFAAPLAMKSFELVLLDEAGKVVAAQPAAEMTDFQPDIPRTIQGTFAIPNASARYKLGVRFINSAGTGARLANELEFKDNINILGYVR